ncbi:MAG: transglycosylase domain-containing protein [Rickettsiales bacterium]|nr:transglycosylase domain-containing protein [Rickettsiales bacterium]
MYSNDFEKIKSYNGNNFVNLDYDDLPSHLINALIATEDRNFFTHRGLSYFGILRALLINLKAGQIKQGGSTITQQLAKMMLKDNSKTYRRKFKELILTREIEKHLTKQDILVFYLNMSYFGNGRYGISEASEYYFAKNVSDLTLEESSMLVGLLKAPTRYNPVNNEDLTRQRTQQVILNMEDAGFLSNDNLIDYLAPDLDFDKYRTTEQKRQNFYFSDYVFKQVQDLNLDKNLLEISVVTTLNRHIQDFVVNITQSFINENESKIDKSEVAVVVMRKNGEILAMLGGKDYAQSQFNRAVNAKRQTGSLFKLFIYLAGFENGLKIDDVFNDERIKIGKWFPENNNDIYRGKITVKEAFEISSNSVAVQISDIFDIKETIKVCNKLGIFDNFKNDYTILLGTRENTLLDMTSAYATVVNNGSPVFPYSIKYILSENNIVYKLNVGEKPQVLKDSTVSNMQYLLYSVVKNGTGRSAKIDELIEKTETFNSKNFDKRYFIGGKTGTSQNNRDAWFIGFVNDYVIGVWFGNDDDTPMNKVVGGSLPARLWREIALSIF